jgi:hypothetical protein
MGFYESIKHGATTCMSLSRGTIVYHARYNHYYGAILKIVP